MLLEINGHIYNLEFQTVNDKTMPLRLLKYELNILLNEISNLESAGEFRETVELPIMAVIQLEKSENLPEQYGVDLIDRETGNMLTRKHRIIKLWEHTILDLAQQDKAMLIPFVAIKNRKSLATGKNESSFRNTIDDVKESYKVITELVKTGQISESAFLAYHNSTTHISQYLLDKYFAVDNPLRKELEMVIAEARQEKTYINWADIYKAEGREEGIEKGIEKGIGIGKAEGAIDILLRLPKPSLDTLKSIAREYNLSDKQLATTISALEDSYKKGKAPNYKLPSEISRFCIAQRNEMMKEKSQKKSLQAEKPTTKKRGDDGR